MHNILFSVSTVPFKYFIVNGLMICVIVQCTLQVIILVEICVEIVVGTLVEFGVENKVEC